MRRPRLQNADKCLSWQQRQKQPDQLLIYKDTILSVQTVRLESASAQNLQQLPLVGRFFSYITDRRVFPRSRQFRRAPPSSSLALPPCHAMTCIISGCSQRHSRSVKLDRSATPPAVRSLSPHPTPSRGRCSRCATGCGLPHSRVPPRLKSNSGTAPLHRR